MRLCDMNQEQLEQAAQELTAFCRLVGYNFTDPWLTWFTDSLWKEERIRDGAELNFDIDHLKRRILEYLNSKETCS